MKLQAYWTHHFTFKTPHLGKEEKEKNNKEVKKKLYKYALIPIGKLFEIRYNYGKLYPCIEDQ